MTARFILTAPAAIGPDAAARVARAIGGAAPARLASDGCAIEARDADPERLEAARAAFPAGDVNLFAGPKRLFLADMDSTLIGCECIDEIADFAGVKPQVAAITERAMQGELDFEAALAERVALLKGLPVVELEQVWRERVRLNDGAATLTRTLAAEGVVTALVSGGFDFFAERVAEACGMASWRANRLGVEDGVLTGRTEGPVLGREAKLERLHALCAAHGLTPAEAIAVGDGANDLAMIGAAGLGVAYRAKPAVADAAPARLDRSPLSAILHLVGVPPARWRRV